jgi:TusA-related sulfurtransferase
MRTLTRRAPFLGAVDVDALKGPRTIQVDLRGLPNPEPVLSLAEEAARLAPGGQLEVVTDDPCASVDFLRWLAGTDIELVEVRCLPEKATDYLFQRPPDREAASPVVSSTSDSSEARPIASRESPRAKGKRRKRVRPTGPLAA